MAAATFLVGIVLALVLGAALAVVWGRVKAASAEARAATDAAGQASQAAQPLAATLARIETQMRELEGQRRQMLGGLEATLSSLTKETAALSNALRAPNTRGRWGELTLRRVAELAGMVPFCDFEEQPSLNGKRPDMIVRLPGGRTIAVDAKAPLSAYLEAEAATGDSHRAAALDRHAQQLSRHVAALATREYWAQFDSSPEMVVLFLPGDHFLSAALERDGELLDRALARKVMLATPVTLVSVLKGIAHGWREQRLAQNADELRRIAGEFHDRVRVFADAYADSGRQLARAIDAYNRSVASWDARLAPSLRRMRELGAGAQEIAEPARIETAAREPQWADLPGQTTRTI
jgi:DNA recombination protein RmuC